MHALRAATALALLALAVSCNACAQTFFSTHGLHHGRALLAVSELRAPDGGAQCAGGSPGGAPARRALAGCRTASSTRALLLAPSCTHPRLPPLLCSLRTRPPGTTPATAPTGPAPAPPAPLSRPSPPRAPVSGAVGWAACASPASSYQHRRLGVGWVQLLAACNAAAPPTPPTGPRRPPRRPDRRPLERPRRPNLWHGQGPAHHQHRPRHPGGVPLLCGRLCRGPLARARAQPSDGAPPRLPAVLPRLRRFLSRHPHPPLARRWSGMS